MENQDSTTPSTTSAAQQPHRMTSLLLRQARDMLTAAAKERSQLMREWQAAKLANEEDIATDLQADLVANGETKDELESLLIAHHQGKLSPGDPRPDSIALSYRMVGLDEEGLQWAGWRPPVEFWGDWNAAPYKWSGVEVMWGKPSKMKGKEVEVSVGPRGESA